ncbi:MAG: DUF1338 domain-containing protein [Prolixibacteraceae bacterium]|nr:DUF1338 domain-containing protein [Prolixibacteraceae bacterium]
MKRTTQEIVIDLFNRLWKNYTKRVSFAKLYSNLAVEKGGQVVIDHVAFRTFNTHTGEQPEGIRAFRHFLLCLGYRIAARYNFEKKKLSAVYFEHEDDTLPKIFVSQLEVEQLPEWAQIIIHNTVRDTKYLLSDHSIELLNILKLKEELPTEAAEYLVKDLVNYFERPWNIPDKNDVLKLNDVSQYAAWVLLHGNSVNHFAALVNRQNVNKWPDIKSTCNALAKAGIPMKDTIEGEEGSLLRQSSTLAVKEDVNVKGETETEQIKWTYGYFEIVERGYLNQDEGKKIFNGFLVDQEVKFFGITQTRDN